MKKFKRAVTDSDNEVRYDRDTKPGIANLLDILAACTGEKPADLAAKYSQYGALKTDAGEAVVALLEPMQAKFKELREDHAELSRLLRIGGERARSIASATLARTYDAIGFARP